VDVGLADEFGDDRRGVADADADDGTSSPSVGSSASIIRAAVLGERTRVPKRSNGRSA